MSKELIKNLSYQESKLKGDQEDANTMKSIIDGVLSEYSMTPTQTPKPTTPISMTTPIPASPAKEEPAGMYLFFQIFFPLKKSTKILFL